MSKTKIKLKDGRVIEWKNNSWHIDNRPISRKSIGNLTIKDTDGYYKKLNYTGGLAVQDYDENGNPIKINYIGSNTKIPKEGTPGREAIVDKVNAEVRDKYWKQAPIMRHAVDSIANAYGINPSIIINRMNEEGYTDNAIKENNFSYLNSRKELKENPNSYDADDFDRIIRESSNYQKLNYANWNGGFNEFGLDDVATMLQQGKVNLINEDWYDTENVNEHKRDVLTANGHRNSDNIGIMAATLKYLRNKAAKDFPNSSNSFLDNAAGIYFNRGETGGKEYIKRNKTKKSLGGDY